MRILWVEKQEWFAARTWAVQRRLAGVLARGLRIPRMVNLFVRDAQQLGSYWKRSNRPIGLSAGRATLRAGLPDDVTLRYSSFWVNFRTAYSSCKIIEFM